ncbi:MAG: NAD-binding protein, partial [Paracoccaceae bacterium]
LNNFFGMTVANAMSEAFAVADATGVDRKALYDVMAAGPLRSGMMDFVAAYALDGDDSKLAFAIKNARKDVGYYRQMTTDAGLASVMSEGAFGGLSRATEAGQADDHVCKMVDFYAKTLGTTQD